MIIIKTCSTCSVRSIRFSFKIQNKQTDRVVTTTILVINSSVLRVAVMDRRSLAATVSAIPQKCPPVKKKSSANDFGKTSPWCDSRASCGVSLQWWLLMSNEMSNNTNNSVFSLFRVTKQVLSDIWNRRVGHMREREREKGERCSWKYGIPTYHRHRHTRGMESHIYGVKAFTRIYVSTSSSDSKTDRSILLSLSFFPLLIFIQSVGVVRVNMSMGIWPVDWMILVGCKTFRTERQSTRRGRKCFWPLWFVCDRRKSLQTHPPPPSPPSRLSRAHCAFRCFPVVIPVMLRLPCALITTHSQILGITTSVWPCAATKGLDMIAMYWYK